MEFEAVFNLIVDIMQAVGVMLQLHVVMKERTRQSDWGFQARRHRCQADDIQRCAISAGSRMIERPIPSMKTTTSAGLPQGASTGSVGACRRTYGPRVTHRSTGFPETLVGQPSTGILAPRRRRVASRRRDLLAEDAR